MHGRYCESVYRWMYGLHPGIVTDPDRRSIMEPKDLYCLAVAIGAPSTYSVKHQNFDITRYTALDMRNWRVGRGA